MRLRSAACALLHFALVTMAAAPSWSQDRPANRAAAAVRFDEGRKAFDAGDFRRAAEAFEAAYGLAPNPDVLWNAARAWQRAGEAAHAATLYSRYLRDAPPGAPDRGTATSELGVLATRLARVEIHGDSITDLTIDDLPSQDRVLYVSRGSHVVTAVVAGKPARKEAQVEAGDVVSIVFDAPPAPAARSDGSPRSEPAAVPAREPHTVEAAHDSNRPTHKTWSPWVFAGGAVLTSVALGLTIASGVDTDNALNKFNSNSTESNLQNGQAKQLRTNILLASTLGLGALTAAAAIWLVDWHGEGQHVQAGFELPGGAVRWTF
jgi:tetratricopeptide (TPR) repeat protein